MAVWREVMYAADVGVVLLIILWGVLTVRSARKKMRVTSQVKSSEPVPELEGGTANGADENGN